MIAPQFLALVVEKGSDGGMVDEQSESVPMAYRGISLQSPLALMRLIHLTLHIQPRKMDGEFNDK